MGVLRRRRCLHPDSTQVRGLARVDQCRRGAAGALSLTRNGEEMTEQSGIVQCPAGVWLMP